MTRLQLAAHYGILAMGLALVVVSIKRAISAQGGWILNELQKLTQEVAEARTVMSSAAVLIKGLKDRLDAAGTDPAKLAALSADLGEGNDALSAAIVANTPAQPEEPAVEEAPTPA